jgi:Ca-activated chloride channel homolog
LPALLKKVKIRLPGGPDPPSKCVEYMPPRPEAGLGNRGILEVSRSGEEGIMAVKLPTKLLIAGVCFIVSLTSAGFSQASSEDKPGTKPPGESISDPRVSITPRIKTPQNTAAEDTERRSSIRIDTTLVLIPVSVTDPMNRFVTGLEKEHFRVFEDKVEQEVKQFSSEDAPLSVGLVFDTSGSMGSKLLKSRQAVAQFFKTANPEDEFFLVQFNDRPELAVPFTRNPEDIQSRLTFTQSKGRTALLDGIYMAMHQMKKAHNPRKALLVISDGGDNSSRYTESEIKNAVREADVQIYAIGIFEPISARSRTAEELAGPGLLNEVCEQTGGRHFPVDNLNELPDIAAKIGIELRNQYVLGYSPKNVERDGKYRRVNVKLVQPRGLPPLKAFFRLGYYAPTH